MKFNPKVMNVVSQTFIKQMMKMGKPDSWKSPYLMKVEPNNGSAAFINFTTGNACRGRMNRFILSMHGVEHGLYAGASQGIKAGLWLDFQNADPIVILRPQKRKGEKEDPDTGEKETFTYLSGYSFVTVYPISDFADYHTKRGKPVTVQSFIDKYRGEEPEEVGPIPDDAPVYYTLEEKVEGIGFTVIHESQTVAYSRVGRPLLNVPKIENMVSVNEAILALLHEVGHGCRWLKNSPIKGGLSKGQEEATAEMFSMLFGAELGYPVDMANTLSYLWGWLGLSSNMFKQKKAKYEELSPEERTAVEMVKNAMQNSMKRISFVKGLMIKQESPSLD